MTDDAKGGAAGPGAAGCALRAAIVATVSIASGIYMMSHWTSLGGGGKAAAVVLVVVGTLLALPVIILLALRLVVQVFVRRVQRQLAEAGAKIVGDARAMYADVHEYREAADA